jgi:hypothetical protein
MIIILQAFSEEQWLSQSPRTVYPTFKNFPENSTLFLQNKCSQDKCTVYKKWSRGSLQVSEELNLVKFLHFLNR